MIYTIGTKGDDYVFLYGISLDSEKKKHDDPFALSMFTQLHEAVNAWRRRGYVIHPGGPHPDGHFSLVVLTKRTSDGTGRKDPSTAADDQGTARSSEGRGTSNRKVRS